MSRDPFAKAAAAKAAAITAQFEARMRHLERNYESPELPYRPGEVISERELIDGTVIRDICLAEDDPEFIRAARVVANSDPMRKALRKALREGRRQTTTVLAGVPLSLTPTFWATPSDAEKFNKTKGTRR